MCDPTCSVAGISTLRTFIAVSSSANSTCYSRCTKQCKSFRNMVNIAWVWHNYKSRWIVTKASMTNDLAARPGRNIWNIWSRSVLRHTKNVQSLSTFDEESEIDKKKIITRSKRKETGLFIFWPDFLILCHNLWPPRGGVHTCFWRTVDMFQRLPVSFVK